MPISAAAYWFLWALHHGRRWMFETLPSALGLAALVLGLREHDATDKDFALVGAAGAFAAVAFLLGSPIVGAFLMLEAVGLAGPRAKIVLMPGLLCSGIGFLVAVGLNEWAGIGHVSMQISHVPAFTHPTGTAFLWAIGFGVGAAALGSAIRLLGLRIRPWVDARPLLLTPVAGLVVAVLAVLFAETTGKAASDVLLSGEESLPTLVRDATHTQRALSSCCSFARAWRMASRWAAFVAGRFSLRSLSEGRRAFCSRICPVSR